MTSIYIRITHQDKFMIAELCYVHAALTHTSANCINYGSNFIIGERFVKLWFFNI